MPKASTGVKRRMSVGCDSLYRQPMEGERDDPRLNGTHGSVWSGELAKSVRVPPPLHRRTATSLPSGSGRALGKLPWPALAYANGILPADPPGCPLHGVGRTQLIHARTVTLYLRPPSTYRIGSSAKLAFAVEQPPNLRPGATSLLLHRNPRGTFAPRQP